MELFVDDAATSGHPLHVASPDHATCAGGVAVFHFAVIDDGDGLEASVRVGAHAPAMAAVGGEGRGGGIVHQQEGAALFGALPVVEHAVHGKAVAHPVASGLVAHVDHGLGGGGDVRGGGARSGSVACGSGATRGTGQAGNGVHGGVRGMGSGCRHRHALQKGRLHGPNIGANDAWNKRGIPHQTVSRNGTMRQSSGRHRFPCGFLHADHATLPSRPDPMGELAGHHPRPLRHGPAPADKPCAPPRHQALHRQKSTFTR